MVRDFTGSGRSGLIVSSPWGMAVLEDQGGSLVSPAISQNGARLNAWLLNTQINHVGPIGRFDGDSRSSLLITSGWGLGILKVGVNGLASTAMLAKGSSIGGPGIGGALSGANSFTVDPTVCRFGPVGDFDGDHSDAVLVRNGTGIATLRQAGTVGLWAGVIAAFSSASRRSAIGGWELSDSDCFGPAADFDGDGRDEVLVFNAEGVGLINLAGSNPGSLVVVANGTAMGSWTLDATQDQFGPAADFDGDGKPELLVSNPKGFALLKYAGGGLTALAVHNSGDWIGGWRLSGGDCLGPAADYNGDGRAEVLISSGWGIGLLSWTPAGWTASSVTANGTALGGWRLDTTRNRMNLACDFDGDGRAELLVSSGWGMGVLDVAKVTSKLAVANGTALGSWRLDTSRNDLEIGDACAEAAILYHSDWTDSVNDTQAVLTQRGTAVRLYSDTSQFKTALQNYAGTCASGDQMFVYLGVHGDTLRQPGDVSRAPCETHGMQATTGYFRLGDIAPSFRAISRRGCDLIVIDGSCEGGETVYDAFGQRYSAMSTTGANEVALTNDPDPGSEASTESKPAVFGTWWTPPHVVGSRLNGLILLEMAHSGRIQQRLYRNDNTAATQAMLFARPALNHLNVLSAWWLKVSGCYLYKLLWPAAAAAAVAQDPTLTWTNPAQSMLDFATKTTAPEKPSLASYQTSVLDPAYDSALANTYAANRDVIWQCMANDGAGTSRPTRASMPQQWETSNRRLFPVRPASRRS